MTKEQAEAHIPLLVWLGATKAEVRKMFNSDEFWVDGGTVWCSGETVEFPFTRSVSTKVGNGMMLGYSIAIYSTSSFVALYTLATGRSV